MLIMSYGFKFRLIKIVIILFCIIITFNFSIFAQTDIDVDLGDDILGPSTSDNITDTKEPLLKQIDKKDKVATKKIEGEKGYMKPNIVKVAKDEKGWKILVDGKNFFFKGVVADYTPIGDNYNFNLWNMSDDFIKTVIDTDFGLMKEMGVNAVRLFSMPPPKWIVYIYKKFGIYTVINDLMGRYGLFVNGKWMFPVDYSNPIVRRTLIRQAIETVKKYKDVPGVLFFLFGNESNYGLEWKSTEIENLPVGERAAAKAKHLYTLFNEVFKAVKKVDKNHPVVLVNGDIQYLDLIKKYCPDLDILGANVYRGISAGDLFERVKKELDKPFLFTEFGCDAYNVKTDEEDQYHQALYVKGQWKEIYHKSYGHGEEANCIGGAVFSLLDGWWKYKQTEDLFIHNTEGGWENGGYKFDYVKGKNNMNEEWWGIIGLSTKKINGIEKRVPRAAYYVLQKVFKLKVFDTDIKTIDMYMDSIDINSALNRGELNLFKNKFSSIDKVRFSGGSIKFEMVGNMYSKDVSKGKEGIGISDGESIFLNFAFKPIQKLRGDISINVLGNVAKKDMEIYYEDRGEAYKVLISTNKTKNEATDKKVIDDNDRVEIYSFSFNYMDDLFDLYGFYHKGHYHWAHEGDMFGLLQEANDIPGYDIYNSKNPIGVLFTGKKILDGLKIIAGPEIYWGANPKVIMKYYRNFGLFSMALLHSEDISTRSQASFGTTSAVQPATRKTSLYVKLNFIPKVDFEVAGLISGPEKIGDTFVRVVKSSGNGYLGSGYDVIKNDSIKFLDTMAVRSKLSIDIGSVVTLQEKFTLAGLVANGGVVPAEMGSMLTDYGTGNKIESVSGILIFLGDILINPNFLYRKPLVGPNPSISGYISTNKVYVGVSPRNIISSPFAVLDNREARIFELCLTYEPTGGTWFYDWDNDEREDAPLAFNLVFDYADYPTITDAYTYVGETGESYAFDSGLPAAKVWSASSKVVINASKNFRTLVRLSAGKQQSTGINDGRLVQFYSMDFANRYKTLMVNGYVKKDMWGIYDYYRQFNLTYPWQVMLDISYGFIKPLFMENYSKIGLKTIFRTYDENSPDNEYLDGANKYGFESTFYYIVTF